MDQTILDTIKQDLMARKEQIQNELSAFAKTSDQPGDYNSNFPQYGDQSDENAQEVSEYTTNIETERILEKTLKDITGALTKIDKGEYGICKYCHQEIDPKRLMIRPFSSACIECKNKLQQAG
jgi:RNA polymerase-binding protein DksA